MIKTEIDFINRKRKTSCEFAVNLHAHLHLKHEYYNVI